MNADDRLSLDPLGRVEGGNRIVEGSHLADVVLNRPSRMKSGSIAESCCRAHVSGGLSHRRPKTIVDQVPPASIRAAARDIACRACDVHVLAVGTCAIN